MSERYPSKSLTVWLIFLGALLLLGCGLTERVAGLRGGESDLIPTRTPLPTYTATTVGANFVGFTNEESVTENGQTEATTEPVATEAVPTPVPTVASEETTAEETTTETTTSTESGEGESTEDESGEKTTSEGADTSVTVTILQNMNVRGGPGTNYPVIGAAPPGATSPVVGRNNDNSWLQVEYPPGSGGTGWVYTQLVQIAGNPTNVAIAQAPAPPPTAPAEPDPQPAEPAPPPAPSYQFTPTGWYASENAAIVHFKGRIHDEFGNLVNGYSVYVSNGAWGTVSHPTGASGWYPDKGDGEWDVSGIDLFQGQGWWWLSVVRYNCDFWAGFDAQCKDFSTLSEEIPIEVRTPEESVINADWVCHWDCDKGLYVEGFRREN